MDEALEPDAQAALQDTLKRFVDARPDLRAHLRFDDIATRRAGQRRFADLHMHVPGDWPLSAPPACATSWSRR